MEAIKKYLNDMSLLTASTQISGYYDALIANGRYYHQQPAYLSKKELKRVLVKQCFANSLVAAFNEPDKYAYIEGFYLSYELGLPMEHSWCLNKQTNQLADFTTTKFGISTDERFGVEIDNKTLIQFAASEYADYLTPLQYCHRMKIGIFKEKKL